MGHGHVKPNSDGSRARCGGPPICSVCARETSADFYDLARRLQEEGVGEIVDAPMGFGAGDLDEVRDAIAKERARQECNCAACIYSGYKRHSL